MLSRKSIPPAERLIVALDVPSAAEARALVARLGDSVRFYKMGLELFTAGGYFELLSELTQSGKKVFVDLKLFDVPETVSAAVRQLSRTAATFVTVHAGNDRILTAATAAKGNLKILAVTMLTSLDQHDMDGFGITANISEVVLSRTRQAVACGCDGVVASGLELEPLRARLGQDFLIVVPGVRPGTGEVRNDDQKRIVNPKDAFMKGADHIVVGRPIRNAADPRQAAESIQETITRLFAG